MHGLFRRHGAALKPFPQVADAVAAQMPIKLHVSRPTVNVSPVPHGVYSRPKNLGRFRWAEHFVFPVTPERFHGSHFSFLACAAFLPRSLFWTRVSLDCDFLPPVAPTQRGQIKSLSGWMGHFTKAYSQGAGGSSVMGARLECDNVS